MNPVLFSISKPGLPSRTAMMEQGLQSRVVQDGTSVSRAMNLYTKTKEYQ